MRELPVRGHPIAEPRRRALAPAETAARLGVTVGELARLRRQGKGPEYVSLNARTIRYIAGSVAEFLPQLRPRSELRSGGSMGRTAGSVEGRPN